MLAVGKHTPLPSTSISAPSSSATIENSCADNSHIHLYNMNRCNKEHAPYPHPMWIDKVRNDFNAAVAEAERYSNNGDVETCNEPSNEPASAIVFASSDNTASSAAASPSSSSSASFQYDNNESSASSSAPSFHSARLTLYQCKFNTLAAIDRQSATGKEEKAPHTNVLWNIILGRMSEMLPHRNILAYDTEAERNWAEQSHVEYDHSIDCSPNIDPAVVAARGMPTTDPDSTAPLIDRALCLRLSVKADDCNRRKIALNCLRFNVGPASKLATFELIDPLDQRLGSRLLIQAVVTQFNKSPLSRKLRDGQQVKESQWDALVFDKEIDAVERRDKKKMKVENKKKVMEKQQRSNQSKKTLARSAKCNDDGIFDSMLAAVGVAQQQLPLLHLHRDDDDVDGDSMMLPILLPSVSLSLPPQALKIERHNMSASPLNLVPISEQMNVGSKCKLSLETGQ